MMFVKETLSSLLFIVLIFGAAHSHGKLLKHEIYSFQICLIVIFQNAAFEKS